MRRVWVVVNNRPPLSLPMPLSPTRTRATHLGPRGGTHVEDAVVWLHLQHDGWDHGDGLLPRCVGAKIRKRG